MKSKPLATSIAPKVGLSFYVLGFQDYLGARTLLNAELLLQGATLASTAVEKYLKALLAAKGLKAFGHLSDWSPKSLSDQAQELGLNADFLALLQLVYRIRYLDNLDSSVSFAIERLKFLAELDFTVSVLNNAVRFFRGGDSVDPYEAARLAGCQELIQRNYLVSNADRHAFLATPDIAEAYYIDSSLEVISCRLTGWVTKKPLIFTEPGVSRDRTGYQCTLV